MIIQQHLLTGAFTLSRQWPWHFLGGWSPPPPGMHWARKTCEGRWAVSFTYDSLPVGLHAPCFPVTWSTFSFLQSVQGLQASSQSVQYPAVSFPPQHLLPVSPTQQFPMVWITCVWLLPWEGTLTGFTMFLCRAGQCWVGALGWPWRLVCECLVLEHSNPSSQSWLVGWLFCYLARLSGSAIWFLFKSLPAN